MSIKNFVTSQFANIAEYDATSGEVTGINASGNITAAYFTGDGGGLSNIQAGGLVGAYSNANVADYLPTANVDILGGTITAALFSGDGGELSNIQYSNLVGAYSNANVADYLPTYTGDISAGNVYVTDTLEVTDDVISTGNVSAALFIGDGGAISNIQYGNVVGAYGDSNVAAYLPGYGGNIAANVVTANVLTLNGDAAISGNLTVAGNIDYQNVQDLVVGDPLIFTGANNTADILDLGLVVQYDDGNAQYGGVVRDHSTGYWRIFEDLANPPTTTVDFANATMATVQAGAFIGDGGQLSNIQYSNLVGAYSNSNVATYLPTANVAILGTTVTGSLFSGDGGELSNIQYSNLVGAYSNSNVAAYLPINEANVKANNINTLGSLVVGKVGDSRGLQQYTATGTQVTFDFNALIPGVPFAADDTLYVSGTGVAGLDGTYTVISCTGFNVTVASTFPAGTGPTTFGALATTTNLQNAAVTGNLVAGTIASNGVLTVSGLSTLATVNASGNVTAPNFIGNGRYLSNINIANIAGSYANSNVAAYLPTYTGELTAGNANLGNAVTANYFIGDGSKLTNIDAGNLVGGYGNANVADYLPTNTASVNANVVTATLFSGNGSQISDINIANIAGSYSNSNVAAYLPTANVAILGTTITGSLFSGDGGELSNIQGGNITGDINISPYNLTAGNATFNGNISVAGNVTVSGNLNYQDVTDLVVGDPLIYIGANNTADIVDLGLVASYNPGAGELHTGFARDHTDGVWKLFTDLVDEPSTVINWANATLGALEAGTFIGDGGFLSNIQAANIVGAYSNSNVAAYLPTANVDILGDVVTATLFSGNGSALTNLPYDTAIVNGTSNVSIPVANGSITFAVAGVKVGTLNQQNNINFGDDAGFSGQSADAIAIGAYAGRLNQGTSAVSLGSTAGNDSQGENAVAIGIFAGSNEQGAEAVAIGDGAGNYQQGTQAVAIGFGAGNFTQLADAIAIGTAAGQSDQGANAIAIGQNAGQNSQGANAIAIGLNAGTNQAANSIIINATGNVLDTTDAGLYIDPVRNDVSNVANVVYYNTDTKELTYAPAAELYGNANVADYLPIYSGNVAANVVFATMFSGDGGELSNIQAGNIVGAYGNANVADYLPTYTGDLTPGNITISSFTDLGNLSNVTITGGSQGQTIITDGAGNLTFSNISAGFTSIPAIYFAANANGNNQTFSNAYLSAYTANTDITLFYNGSLLESDYYSLSNSTLTVNTPLTTGDSIDIIQQVVGNINPLSLLPRSINITSAATITPNVATSDQLDVLALATAATFAAPTGVTVDAQRFTFRIKDNGSSQTLSWNAIYREIGVLLPTATTPSKVMYVGCIYNSQDSLWDVVSVVTQA